MIIFQRYIIFKIWKGKEAREEKMKNNGLVQKWVDDGRSTKCFTRRELRLDGKTRLTKDGYILLVYVPGERFARSYRSVWVNKGRTEI